VQAICSAAKEENSIRRKVWRERLGLREEDEDIVDLPVFSVNSPTAGVQMECFLYSPIAEVITVIWLIGFDLIFAAVFSGLSKRADFHLKIGQFNSPPLKRPCKVL